VGVGVGLGVGTGVGSGVGSGVGTGVGSGVGVTTGVGEGEGDGEGSGSPPHAAKANAVMASADRDRMTGVRHRPHRSAGMVIAMPSPL
jgi:hypothetical protein